MVFLAMLIVVIAASVMSADDAQGQPTPVAVAVDSADGRGRSVTPGRSCSEGADPETPGRDPGQGTGAYWHYEYGAPLASGKLSNLAGETLVHLDLHSDVLRYQNADGVYPEGTDPRAFLQGEESHASLLNDRGSVKVRLASGTCEAPTLAFDGANASGTGTWRIESATGAYRDIVGSGSFNLHRAEVNPGADNVLDLDLNGTFDVPAPSLDVTVLNTFWGSLGTDYLTRRVSVTYQIQNTGPGDAFGVNVTNMASAPGATPMTGFPIPLGDMPAGESRVITIRHQLALLSAPCFLVILGCNFQTTVTANLPDALDRPHVLSDTVAAKAPLLPPPL
jgi:hypothetical protein